MHILMEHDGIRGWALTFCYPFSLRYNPYRNAGSFCIFPDCIIELLPRSTKDYIGDDFHIEMGMHTKNFDFLITIIADFSVLKLFAMLRLALHEVVDLSDTYQIPLGRLQWYLLVM